MGSLSPEKWLERRREFWPNSQTRAEAARLYAARLYDSRLYADDGVENLKEVLERYPDEVISERWGNPPAPVSRRAIWAHQALLQEKVGWEPTIDRDDRVAVERSIREEGLEIAQARSGSELTEYLADFPELHRFPNLTYYANQAPASWRSGGTNE